MQSEPLELIGSIKEQLVIAAGIAAEKYAEEAGLAHQGYSEDQINDLLIEDLNGGVSRGAVSVAINSFIDSFPKDIPNNMTESAMRGTLIAALQECNKG